MKNCFIQIILFSILCVFVSCKSKEVKCQFTAKPIVKTVGKIDIVVDPKVEMMMILGRLDKVHPYADFGVNNYGYLNKIDDYFSTYKNKDKIFYNNDMAYQRLPEFGMYLKDDMSDFIMQIDNENFVTTDGPALNNSYYNTNKYIECNYSAPKILGIMQDFQQRQVLQLQRRLFHVFLLSRYKNGF